MKDHAPVLAVHVDRATAALHHDPPRGVKAAGPISARRLAQSEARHLKPREL
jgi:hypothetical protein